MNPAAEIQANLNKLRGQVSALVAKNGSTNMNAMQTVIKAERIFNSRVATYDTPAEAAAYALHAIETQLEGQKSARSYKTVADDAIRAQHNNL
jgi:hypothetical protein